MGLRRIIYRSPALERFSKRALLDMLHESRAFNTIDNISGVLIHKEGLFIEVIEGETIDLKNLFTRILKDHRHHKIEII
jgi:hypothetical protein